jgi:predicted HicB family RNase H-like nuclease
MKFCRRKSDPPVTLKVRRFIIGVPSRLHNALGREAISKQPLINTYIQGRNTLQLIVSLGTHDQILKSRQTIAVLFVRGRPH